jgi:uncharacterized membrane protein YidH (DUF202 family)
MPEPPGLAEERTNLAWTRSGIALLGAFAILVRRVWTGNPATGDLVALALLGVAGFGWAVGILGWRLAHHRRDEAQPRRPGELLAVSIGTVALAAAGLVVTFVNG